MRGAPLFNVMRGARRSVLGSLALALGLLVPACNRADEFASCVDTSDPAATSGERAGQCAASLFVPKDTTYRDISGHVWAGESGAEATLRVEGADGFDDPETFAPVTIRTDALGNYASIRGVPLSYDLTASFGSQILVTRGLVFRGFEPTLDDPFPPYVPGGSFSLTPSVAKTFSAHVDVVLAEPLPAGKALAFFTTGDTTASVTGDLTQGLTVTSTTFTILTTLYAYAYDVGGDLSTITASGKAQVNVSGGSTTLVTVALKDLDPNAQPKKPPILSVYGPEGYSLSSFDGLVVYSRTSRAYVTKLVPGVAKRVPLFPESQFTAYRLILKGDDGSTLDSGIAGFDIYSDTNVTLAAYRAPTVASPAANATVALTDAFVASGPGVYEHTFAPQTTGPTIHLLTGSGEAHLPDFAADNLAVPHGAYTWTVRSFPKSATVSAVSGRDARRNQVSATSAPRTIIFP